MRDQEKFSPNLKRREHTDVWVMVTERKHFWPALGYFSPGCQNDFSVDYSMGTNPEHLSAFICRPGPEGRFHILCYFCHRKLYPSYVTEKSSRIILEYFLRTQKGDSDNPLNPNNLHWIVQAINYILHTKETNIFDEQSEHSTTSQETSLEALPHVS